MSKDNSLSGRYKDWSSQGIRFQTCYIDDWDEIKIKFKTLGLELYEHGPIITIDARKNVTLAYELMMEIKDDPKIRKWASVGVEAVSKDDLEISIRKNIFVHLLRVIPEFCRTVAIDEFRKFMNNGNSGSYMEELFYTSGTIKDIEKQVDEIVSRMAKEVRG